jgi:hypothetical protein
MPQAAQDVYPDAVMRDMLASIRVRARLSADELLALLPFRMADLAGFRLLHADPHGAATFTDGPVDTAQPAIQPFFSVTRRSAPPPDPSQYDAFAKRLLAPFANAVSFRVLRSETVRIGGQQGHELIGTMRDRESGAELTLVQWLRFGPGGHVQMLGAARTDAWPDIFPRLRTLRDGVETR